MPLEDVMPALHVTLIVVVVAVVVMLLMVGVVITDSAEVPDMVEVCTLVAFMLTAVRFIGAVKTPLLVMVPADVLHVTAELKVPNPVTVVVQVEVAPA